MRFLRQLGSELRKLVHPTLAAAILGAALVAAAIQIMNARTPYPAPSSADLVGSLWIAADQLSSTLGFIIGGFVAAVGTAAEIRSGTFELVLLHEPRRTRLVAVKVASCLTALALSFIVVTGLLRVSAAGSGWVGHPVRQTSSAALGDAASHVARFLLVAALIATIATLVAVASRSELATVAITSCAFAIPLLLLGAKTLSFIFPSRWIINWMYYDPFGAYVDYFASDSKLDTPSPAAGLVIFAASCGCAALTVRLLARPEMLGGERH